MPQSAASTAHESSRTTVTFVRHGESLVSVGRIIGGKRSCTGLSALGRLQAQRLCDRVAGDDVLRSAVLVSSDFPRAIETAQIIRPSFVALDPDATIEQWSDLGEHDPGPEIDGMTFESYVERFGTPEWSGDLDVTIFPGGETTRQFHRRVDRGLSELCETFAGRHVVVVCHGGVVDAAFRILLDVRRSGGFELHTLNTALTTLSVEPGNDDPVPRSWRLECFNDAGHLAGLDAETPRRSSDRPAR